MRLENIKHRFFLSPIIGIGVRVSASIVAIMFLYAAFKEALISNPSPMSDLIIAAVAITAAAFMLLAYQSSYRINKVMLAQMVNDGLVSSYAADVLEVSMETLSTTSTTYEFIIHARKLNNAKPSLEV